MGKKFKVWLDSGANIHSCRKLTISLDDIGLSDEDFEGMSEAEKEEMFRDIAFQNSDWGWEEIE